MKQEKDTCLERFKKEWTNRENNTAQKAKVLDLQIKYVKKLYSITPEWRTHFSKCVTELEKAIPELGLKDFHRVAKVIADARRALRSNKIEYGTGFQRQPTRVERKEIAKFRSPTFANGDQGHEPESGDGTNLVDALLASDMDDDDDE